LIFNYDSSRTTVESNPPLIEEETTEPKVSTGVHETDPLLISSKAEQ